MLRTSLAFVSVLLMSLTVFAKVDGTLWPKLIQKAIAEGTSMDTDWGTFRTLSKITPDDETVTHVAEYFSPVGIYDGVEGPTSQIEAVSENWVDRGDGTWTVDQWLFSAFPEDGTLFRSAHVFMVRTDDGSILQYDSVPTTDEEIEAQWQRRVDMWQGSL